MIIPQVENVYQEDRKAVEQIQSYPETNSVVIDYHYDDKVMYECLAFAGENTKVMFTAYENVVSTHGAMMYCYGRVYPRERKLSIGL